MLPPAPPCRLEAPLELTAINIQTFCSEMLAETASRGGPLEIDMHQVNFIDSSGLGGLVGLRKQLAKESRPVRLLNVPARVLKIIEMTRLHSVFEIIFDPPSDQVPA